MKLELILNKISQLCFQKLLHDVLELTRSEGIQLSSDLFLGLDENASFLQFHHLPDGLCQGGDIGAKGSEMVKGLNELISNVPHLNSSLLESPGVWPPYIMVIVHLLCWGSSIRGPFPFLGSLFPFLFFFLFFRFSDS